LIAKCNGETYSYIDKGRSYPLPRNDDLAKAVSFFFSLLKSKPLRQGRSSPLLMDLST